MQSIGERLEEARKRRGISVREASEATKIRGDFLLSFESNQFDVGLPEIYVRGFLRNYAGFLKIDAEKIATDFNAGVLADTKAQRKDSRELFGRLEIPERKAPAPDGTAPAPSTGPARRRGEEIAEAGREPGGPDLATYVKIGAIIVAGVIAVLVIVLLIKWIVGSASSPGPAASGASTPAAVETQSAAGQLETIRLVASDNVRVKVTQVSDGVTLFDGPLGRGESRDISKRGNVLITYDVGTNLRIEKNGRQFKMPIDGMGRSSFN
jgi:cytoskeleton protein RodZ